MTEFYRTATAGGKRGGGLRNDEVGFNVEKMRIIYPAEIVEANEGATRNEEKKN